MANGTLYVGGEDHIVYAFDADGVTGCGGSPKTCAPLWTARTGGTVSSSPALVNGVVFVGSGDHRLYAFDAAGITGCSGAPKVCTPLWSADTGSPIGVSSPAVAGGRVFVGTSWDGLRAYQLSTVGR